MKDLCGIIKARKISIDPKLMEATTYVLKGPKLSAGHIKMWQLSLSSEINKLSTKRSRPSINFGTKRTYKTLATDTATTVWIQTLLNKFHVTRGENGVDTVE